MMGTVIVLAAGIGARFGKGVKQLAPIGQQGEPLMLYSVQDAMSAGFTRFIFVIRREIHNEFVKAVYEPLRGSCAQCEIVYQETPAFRKTPLGTGQAVMLCREYITEPFAVINADDYYGREAFEKAYEYLYSNPKGERYGTIGYTLRNTLSDSGGVTRGVCVFDNAGRLAGIKETKNIRAEGGTIQGLTGDEIVAVNFWLFPPSFVVSAEKSLHRTINEFDPVYDEWILPDIVDDMIRNDKIHVDVLTTKCNCVGMTYASDIEKVKRELLR